MDITSFSVNGAPPANRKSGDFERQWWKLRPDEAAKAIQSTVRFLSENQTARQMQIVVSTRLYGNAPTLGAPGLSYTRAPVIQSALKDRVTYNVVQSCIDTATAKIGKNRPKPWFLTDGGDHEDQRKAKGLNKFVEGIFYENDAYDMGPIAFRDGCIWGDGLVKVYPAHGRVRWDRVLPHELFVDELEAFYGTPRSMHQCKEVDRSVLAALFPNKAALIREAQSATTEMRSLFPNVSDLVTVRESWHLPSGPDAKDGAHLISIDEHALTPMDEWEQDSFPFARFRWSPRPYGYWSQGGAEQIQGIQLEINQLLSVVQRSTKISGSFYWLIENGSKVAKSLITNELGTVLPYTGTKPEVIVPAIVPPEIYQQVTELIQRAHEQFGISQLSAASQKPAGLDSGKALREYNDIESDRFWTVGREYERFFLDLAKLSIACAKEIADEHGGHYPVSVSTGRATIDVDWAKVGLEEDDYVMQCFPISSLPNDPEGRMQTVQELVQAGMIPPSLAPQLMDFPDLKQYETLANAMEDRLHEIFDAIVDEGEYSPPEPFYNPQRARELCLQYILRGESQDLDPDRMELLQTFMSQLDVLEQQAMAATQPPPGAATPVTPQAQPLPPPQSDLVPNAPGIGAA